MPLERPLRLVFAIGCVGVLGSVATGAVWQLLETGTPPPLMWHPLEPARAALEAGDPAGYVGGHRAFAAIQPRDAGAQLKLGVALARTGDRPGAIDALEAALRLHPVPPQVHARLAALYLQDGRLQEAREQARLARDGGARVNPAVLRRLGLAG